MSKKTVYGASIFMLLGLFTAGCSVEPVEGGNNPGLSGPTITITSPVEGFVSTNGNVTVSGTASDSDGVIGTYLIIDTGSAKKIGTTSFNTNITLTSGAHVLKIYAFDSQANSSVTNVRNVTVNISGPDNTPPVLTVTKPSQATTIYSSMSVQVSGTASDDKSGVEGVYLSVNLGGYVKIGTASFNTNLSFLDGTTNTLKLIAKDISNNISATNIYKAIIDFSYITPNWDFETWPEPYFAGYPQNWTNGIKTGAGWWTNQFTSVGRSALDAGYGGTGYAILLQQSSGTPMIWNIYQLAVTPGDYVVLRYWAKLMSGAPAVTTYAAFYSGTNQTGYIGSKYGVSVSLSSSWKEIKSVYQIGAGTNYAFMGIEGVFATGTFLADNVTFGRIIDLDVTAPNTAITSPINNYTTGIGTVNVSGTSLDDIAVKKVYAAIGSVTNSTTNSVNSWAIALDASSLSPNTYQLLAWSEDYAGKKSTVISQNITLTNVPFPTVNLVQYIFDGSTALPSYSNPNTSNTIMNTSDGSSTFYGSGTSFSDNGWPLDTSWGNYFIFKVIPINKKVNLKKLIFSGSRSGTGPVNYKIGINGADISGASGAITGTDSWKTYTNNLSSVTNVSYIVIKIYANSASGITGTFRIDSVTLTGSFTSNDVVPDSSNPNLAISTPVNNYTNIVGTVINVTGTSSDDYGVEKVYAAIGSVTNSTTVSLNNWAIPFNTETFNTGNYTLSAWAVDYAGKKSSVASRVITLTNSPFAVVNLVKYYFDGTNNRASFTNAGASNSIFNSSDGTVTYPSGVSPTPTNSFSDIGWPLDTTWGNYFIFKVYPINKKINLSNITFNAYRSGTGPLNYKIEVNGVSRATGTILGSTAWNSYNIDLSAVSNLNIVVIKIYANSASSAAGTFRIDNVILSGSYSANNVTPDSSNPTVTITAPANNYTNIKGTIINVSGTSADDWGVEKVYAVLGNVTNILLSGLNSWSTSFDTALFGAGNYTLSAWAKDYSGKFSSLDTRSITLTNPPGIPEVDLVKYIFDGSINRASYTNSSTSNTIFNSSDGSVTYPAGVAPTAPNSISDNGWPLDTTWGNYYILTVFPLSGKLDLTSIMFSGYRTATGPVNYKIQVNGVDISGAAGSILGSTTWNSYTNNLSVATNLTSAVIKIFANSASGGTGTFRIDNFTLKGKLIP